MIKIVTVIGARPQFIKAAPLSIEIQKHSEIEEIVIHTGQHFDNNMSDVFFEELGLPTPNYTLNINNLSHGAMTGRMMEEIEKILIKENPKVVIVFGDTNSTLAGALAAKKLHIKVAHIEAGLRSFNMEMPEEINRILTDRISDYLFCPTITAINNLKAEGYDSFNSTIINSGDIMLDAALYFGKECEKYSTVKNSITNKPYVLATIHRAENTDCFNKLNDIVEALNQIHVETPVIVPLHPRTKAKLREYKIKLEVTTIEPVGYFDMLKLIKNSLFTITDSGGLQKESYFFNKRCLVLREETEWAELVESKIAILAGSDLEKIKEVYQTFKNLPSLKEENTSMYGKGEAARLIIDKIVSSNK